MSASVTTVPDPAGPDLADSGDRAVSDLLRALFSSDGEAEPRSSGAPWPALLAFLRGGPPPPAAGRRRFAPPLPRLRPLRRHPAGREPLLVPGWGAWAGPLPGRLRGRVAVAVVDDVPVAVAWPEYAPPALVARLPAAVAAMARHAAAVVVPDDAAGSRVRALLAGEGRVVPVIVVRRPSVLALPGPAAEPPGEAALPYLVACGPLEARSNTLLLLQLWRSLGRDGPAPPPRLVLAGARGTDAEDIRPLLDWNEELRALVTEAPGLSPGELRALLGGAGALLAPDFAGADAALLRDAARAGVPVVAAEAAILQAPPGSTLLDPLDGPGWGAAIRAAARRALVPAPAAAPAEAAAYRVELLRLIADRPAP